MTACIGCSRSRHKGDLYTNDYKTPRQDSPLGQLQVSAFPIMQKFPARVIGQAMHCCYVSHSYVRELRLPDGVAQLEELTGEQIQPILLD